MRCLYRFNRFGERTGIKLVACQMTVDLLGLKEEEIMEGVEFAGVGAYLADASDGNVNLFI